MAVLIGICCCCYCKCKKREEQERRDAEARAKAVQAKRQTLVAPPSFYPKTPTPLPKKELKPILPYKKAGQASIVNSQQPISLTPIPSR